MPPKKIPTILKPVLKKGSVMKGVVKTGVVGNTIVRKAASKPTPKMQGPRRTQKAVPFRYKPGAITGVDLAAAFKIHPRDSLGDERGVITAVIKPFKKLKKKR